MKLIGYEFVNYKNKDGREVKGFRLSVADTPEQGKTQFGFVNAATVYVKMSNMPNEVTYEELENCIKYEKEVIVSYMPDRYDRTKLGDACFRIL